jgi:hypothetical protein
MNLGEWPLQLNLLNTDSTLRFALPRGHTTSILLKRRKVRRRYFHTMPSLRLKKDSLQFQGDSMRDHSLARSSLFMRFDCQGLCRIFVTRRCRR